MRKASRKYEDSDAKRKNSNSDKEDASEQALIHGRGSISTGAGNNGDSDMQHRQRKQRNNLNNNSSKRNSCDKTDNDEGGDHDQHESEVYLKDGRIVEQLKMKTFHASPAHSAASSNQTEQTTNSMAASLTTVDVQLAGHPTDPSVGGAREPRAPLAGHDSMHSLNGSLNGDPTGPANGALKARVRPQNQTKKQDSKHPSLPFLCSIKFSELKLIRMCFFRE